MLPRHVRDILLAFNCNTFVQVLEAFIMALGAETSGRNPQKPSGFFCHATHDPGRKEFVHDVCNSANRQTNKPMRAKHDHFWGR